MGTGGDDSITFRGAGASLFRSMNSAFFRYAHSRGWCREGLAAIDAPRIYRLESLPRGPAWSDVHRLLASCAGETPSEIRDHAMLLVVATYGVRSGEVRDLCLEDID